MLQINRDVIQVSKMRSVVIELNMLNQDSCISDLRAIVCSFSDMARLGWKRKNLRFVVYRPGFLDFVEMDDGKKLADILENTMSCISNGRAE